MDLLYSDNNNEIYNGNFNGNETYDDNCNDTEMYENENENDQVHEHQVESGKCYKTGPIYNADEILIELIKNQPHLYDQSLKEFKDAQLKENSWHGISEIMSQTVTACQNRWVRLRDRFTKEKRLREAETQSGSEASHRSGFPLYNNLLFLENHIKRRKSYHLNSNPRVKRQLIDTSNTCSSNFNIVTSNASSSNQASISSTNSFLNLFSSVSFEYSKESDTQQTENIQENCTHYTENIEESNIIHQTENIEETTTHQTENVQESNTHQIANIQDNNIQQTENVIELHTSSHLCSSRNFSDMNEIIVTNSKDLTSRDSASRNSVPSDSTSRESVCLRDSTQSPILRALPTDEKSARLIKMKETVHGINTLLNNMFEFLSLNDSEKHMTNQLSQQIASIFDQLTPDDTIFGLMVASELKKIPELEKTKIKQAIMSLFWKNH
ncbi:PREDICTED: uncharacterized protein LOC105453288 [Wasmannia auropunctata]|uniref:uncharacterized protein LOC105453288 n=1 Tax=Wasmannia auropunctata TaxID=64793 RepID=UPI0005EE98C1|nr:PREDICTED: uncharacterized protein LOC105453288 [Wasmannia auropunctata]